MREVSDSLHLRRFCLIPLDLEVPGESTVGKLTRRLGPETVAEQRRHRLRRSRLKGGQGEHTWSGRAVFADNAETHGRYARAEHEEHQAATTEPKAKPCSSYFPRPPRLRPAESVYPGEVARFAG